MFFENFVQLKIFSGLREYLPFGGKFESKCVIGGENE